jgi:hypothetical protein
MPVPEEAGELGATEGEGEDAGDGVASVNLLAISLARTLDSNDATYPKSNASYMSETLTIAEGLDDSEHYLRYEEDCLPGHCKDLFHGEPVIAGFISLEPPCWSTLPKERGFFAAREASCYGDRYENQWMGRSRQDD